MDLLAPLLDFWRLSVEPWFATNPFARLYLLLIVFDVAAGTLLAVKTKTLSSSISRDGVLRKATMVLMVGLAELLEPVAQMPLSEIVAAGFVVTEGLSILENAALLGAPVPEILKDVLAKVPGSSDQKPPAPPAPPAVQP